MEGLDIIGDIHGHAEPLRALLKKLGYQLTSGSTFNFRHPSRKAVFVGDFIDRGPHQREVIHIARSMTEEGSALAIMGNHEYNALAYHTPDPEAPGEFLRPHTEKNRAQHLAFLSEYEQRPTELRDTLTWFYTLPLWLEFEQLRIVHATWCDASMASLKSELGANNTLTEDLLVKSSRKHEPAHNAVETLLKGLEARLPNGMSYTDKDNNPREHARLKWWKNSAGKTWRSLALVPDRHTQTQLPDIPLPAEIRTGYCPNQPAVFFGHYWMQGKPTLQAHNAVCVDYSVAKENGKLVAYRWDNEATLDAKRMVWVG